MEIKRWPDKGTLGNRRPFLLGSCRFPFDRILRRSLPRYIGHRRRGRVQQRADDGLELFLGNLDGNGHLPIIRPKDLFSCVSWTFGTQSVLAVSTGFGPVSGAVNTAAQLIRLVQ